jgi:hypothetical protein
MRPNNRQRSRGGRSGGGGNHNHHKQQQQQHTHNPNRPPNRNQIFDSSGPDVRVRGNAHQVFDKYQALAREAGALGDRIMAEAYWQYADHYYRLIQTMGGFTHRNNQGWGEGEEGQQGNPQQQQGQPNGQQADGGGNGGNNDYAPEDRQSRPRDDRPRDDRPRDEAHGEGEPGLGGVAFLQNGRGTPANPDPAADEQPEVPEFTPTGRRS